MLRCVRLQLHLPSTYTDEMFRHQLASSLIQGVDFFFPKLQAHLKKNNLSFNAYVMGVYNGQIWADEFMLGAVAHMFNIQITVISPFYVDIWNVFHDGTGAPDVVLVMDGMDFGTNRYNITHFSATKGLEKDWKCVGYDIKLKNV